MRIMEVSKILARIIFLPKLRALLEKTLLPCKE